MAKKGKRLWFFLLLLLIVAGIVGYAMYKKSQKPKGTAVDFDEVKVRTIEEKVSASGRIFPEKEIKISSDVSGEIVELYVAEGDSVKLGQLLAKIDPEAYVSAVQRGEASVSGAKSQLAVTKSQKETSIAQKEQIQVQLKNAKIILERNKSLLKDGIISQADYDQSQANADNLAANLRSAEASIRAAEQSIKGSQFNVESMTATLKELKTNLGRTTIKAPVSGIISSLSVEQGERVVGTIQMTGTEMMRIANLNTMEVQVDVSENDIVRVNMDDKVDIEVDAYLGENIKGTVTEIANSASNIGTAGVSLNTDQVTNFIVKVRIDSDSYKNLLTKNKYPFRPGMSASVEIYTNKASDVLSVPIQAVTAREMKKEDNDTDNNTDNGDGDNNADNNSGSNNGGNNNGSKKGKSDDDFKEVVFVSNADTVAMKEVVTGLQDDEYIEIISGIEKGESIISGPYSAISSKLKDGAQVHKKEDKDKKDTSKKD